MELIHSFFSKFKCLISIWFTQFKCLISIWLTLSVLPTLTMATLTMAADPSSLPNLIPYQPLGWADKIVVSTSTGTNTNDKIITSEDNIYVTWAILNDSQIDILLQFKIALYVDGVLKNTWNK